MIQRINEKILDLLKLKKDDFTDFDTSKNRIDLYLLNNKIINEEVLLQVYKQLFNLDIVDLNLINVDYDIVKQFTSDFIDKYHLIPLKLENDVLDIGITDPFDIYGIDKINCFIKDKKIHLVLCSKSKLLTLKQKVFSVISRKSLVDEQNKLIEQDEVNDELSDITSSYIVKLVDSIIKEAICLSASDIHLEPFDEIVNVRYRIDGTLVNSSSLTKEVYKSITSRIKILANLDISKTLIPQDGRITFNYNRIDYDLRISSIPVINGERIVIRILNSKGFNYNLENIGFSLEDLEYIRKVIDLPYGIILLTGPTGSGKSTTLYVFLKELLKKDLNIITVEDPVEYNIPGINQINVNNKTNLTFGVGLKAILRQDPNIIMIGEIRDEETASTAVRAAITGHLVFSTLHTNTAVSTVNRLVDMNVKPYFLSDALACVINQRLIRKLCPHCKKEISLNTKEFSKVYIPTGCPACNNTGYLGRIMVYEILKVTDEVKKLITEGASTQEIQKFINTKGFKSITNNTKKLVNEGITSIDELLKIKYDLNE